ncbi:hypothetical protein L3X38_025093 [Prunus dulcis]|uniref:Uncharacterized protein n=1 Tax=Prunus dulcis TaxID=3755 RepID=A0AAD4Z6R4_PRUDU|nr:hypothetical protein L3X38_025093 [Prunus dulcis]
MSKDDESDAASNTASVVVQSNNANFHAEITLTEKNYDMWPQANSSPHLPGVGLTQGPDPNSALKSKSDLVRVRHLADVRHE